MFSLIIPTHNRATILKRSLTHLLQLDGIRNCEVIVVNDGSTDETAAVLEQFRQLFPDILRLFTLSNGGPARARNCGLRAATNERILFVDDDVFPRPGMLQSHWEMLDAGYTGSQGVLLWHEDIRITDLIRYIDSRGSQFAFDRVKDPGCLEFAYVYTGNFAVLRSAVLEAGGFDESFGFSAFEDTTLAYHLVQNGASLALNKYAIADHLHDMTEDDYLGREYRVGHSFGRILEKYPGMARSLGLARKDFLVGLQVQLLQLVNDVRVVRSIVGPSVSMRLRHRRAFYSGLLQFKQESAAKQTEVIQ